MSRVLIDQLPSGRFRVRAENPNGSLVSLGTFETKEEAEHVRKHMRAVITEKGIPRRAPTLRNCGEKWLDRRELSGVRSIRADRSRWTHHVLTSPLANLELSAIRKVDIKRWRDRLLQKRACRRGPNGTLVDAGRNISPKTVRETMLLVRACLADAVEDELIRSNPAPGVKLPKANGRKAFSYLYPEEDQILLGCQEVPLAYRLLYGFLAREGLRVSGALKLTWDQLDLDRGAVRLDRNKTDDPRAWKLDPGVTRALRWWRRHRRDPYSCVFVGARGHKLRLARAETFRSHLRKAGVRRPELFEQSAHRQRLRLHDLRATFVTLSLAAGRTETWVQDRTGHTTNAMLQRYRRAARTVRELGLGELGHLDLVIPEIKPERDPQSDPFGVHPSRITRLARRLKTHRPYGHPGSSPGGATSEIVEVLGETPEAAANAVDQFVDQAHAFIAALGRGDDAAAETQASALALAVGAVLDEASGLRAQILKGNTAMVPLAVKLLELLVLEGREEDERG